MRSQSTAWGNETRVEYLRRGAVMPQYHRGNISRLEDIEGLLVTAQSLLSRLPDDELEVTKECLCSSLSELREARLKLVSKWPE